MKKLLQLRDMRYAPNGDPTDPKVITAVTNLAPTSRGTYKPAATMVASNYTVLGSTLGASIIKRADGTVGLYVGATTKLYEGDGTNAWTDRSKVGGYTNTATSWQFAVYGNVVIATNNVDTPQFANGAGATFADLTNAPKAKCITVLNNAVLLFNYDNGSRVYDGWFASDVDDYTDWVATAANQVANGRLIDTPGPINAAAVINGTAVVWKQRGMYIGRYVGGDTIWSWTLLNADIGCVGPDAWVETDVGLVFVSERDVFLYDGASLRVIAGPDIRSNLLNSPYAQGTMAQIKLSYDPVEGLVYVFTNNSGSGSGCDHALLWSHFSQKWGAAGSAGLFGNATYSYVKTVFRNTNFPDQRTRNLLTAGGATGVAVFESGAKPVLFIDGYGNYGGAQISFLNSSILGAGGKDVTVTRIVPQYIGVPTNSGESMTVTLAPSIAATGSGGNGTWDSTNMRFDGVGTGRYANFAHNLTAELSGYDVFYEEGGIN